MSTTLQTGDRVRLCDGVDGPIGAGSRTATIVEVWQKMYVIEFDLPRAFQWNAYFEEVEAILWASDDPGPSLTPEQRAGLEDVASQIPEGGLFVRSRVHPDDMGPPPDLLDEETP